MSGFSIGRRGKQDSVEKVTQDLVKIAVARDGSSKSAVTAFAKLPRADKQGCVDAVLRRPDLKHIPDDVKKYLRAPQESGRGVLCCLRGPRDERHTVGRSVHQQAMSACAAMSTADGADALRDGYVQALNMGKHSYAVSTDIRQPAELFWDFARKCAPLVQQAPELFAILSAHLDAICEADTPKKNAMLLLELGAQCAQYIYSAKLLAPDGEALMAMGKLWSAGVGQIRAVEPIPTPEEIAQIIEWEKVIVEVWQQCGRVCAERSAPRLIKNHFDDPYKKTLSLIDLLIGGLGDDIAEDELKVFADAMETNRQPEGFAKLKGVPDELRAYTKRILDPTLFAEFAPQRKNLLLYGKAGSGKTSDAHAIAAVLGADLWSPQDLISSYQGQSSKELSNLFKLARDYARNNARKVVLFFDESDMVIGSRVKKMEHRGANDYSELTNAILRESDPSNPHNENIIVIVATNSYANIDQSVLDRFYAVGVELPKKEIIAEILREELSKTTLTQLQRERFIACLPDECSYRLIPRMLDKAIVAAIAEDKRTLGLAEMVRGFNAMDEVKNGELPPLLMRTANFSNYDAQVPERDAAAEEAMRRQKKEPKTHDGMPVVVMAS